MPNSSNIVRFKYFDIFMPALMDKRKYICITGGRRTGKTYHVLQYLVEKCLVSPKTSCLWVDVKLDASRRYIEREIRGKMLKEHFNRAATFNQSPDRLGLQFANGSYIDFRSKNNPAGLEGFEYDLMVCNEAGHIFTDGTLWRSTLEPMTKRGRAFFVGTPKGMNFWKDLCDMHIRFPDRWGFYNFPASTSPRYTEDELLAIKAGQTPEMWAQEYEGKFLNTSIGTICRHTHKTSWRDDDDTPYTIDNAFIVRQLAGNGYYFCSFDGGVNTTHSAAIIGYHNEDLSRDILLAEFYSQSENDDLYTISLQVKAFCDYHRIYIPDMKVYGDPAISIYDNHHEIADNLGIDVYEVDCLHSLQRTDHQDARDAFRNRKKRRLGLLSRDVYTLASDGKPRIVLIPELSKGANPFGCPNFYKGIFRGQFRYEISLDQNKRSYLTSNLEQIPPITDICDAYTYYALATRYSTPIRIEDNRSYNSFNWHTQRASF